MHYEVDIRPRAMQDLKPLRRADVERILAGVEALGDDLAGDVTRLTNFTPEYRLRVGDYRVLFDVADDVVLVRRVLHRREAYRR